VITFHAPIEKPKAGRVGKEMQQEAVSQPTGIAALKESV